jgi:hypothetical protein
MTTDRDITERPEPMPQRWTGVVQAHCSGGFVAVADYMRAMDTMDALRAEVARLAQLDVTRILLAVVPGDGDGEEVYARSVEDVEAALSKLAERAEDAELALERERVRRVRAEAVSAELAKTSNLLTAKSCAEWGRAERAEAEAAALHLNEHQQRWVDNRAAILEAMRAAGLMLVSSQNGWALVKRPAQIDAARAREATR